MQERVGGIGEREIRAMGRKEGEEWRVWRRNSRERNFSSYLKRNEPRIFNSLRTIRMI